MSKTWELHEDYANQYVLSDYLGNWQRVNDLELYVHKTRQLAICQTLDGRWIIIEDQKNPMLAAEYGSLEELFVEWSHA